MRTPRPDTRRATGRRQSERGAVIIIVAISLLGLLAFGAFSVDHGIMITSRAQAQNAADAGAMAAALYLALDDGTDLAGARAAGIAAAQQNLVWGAAPDVTVADVTFPPCPLGAPGPVDQCVRVAVFRNQARLNPLPVFFASLAGVGDHGVRATATAQVLYGSAPGDGDCIKPFAIPDRWVEQLEDEVGAAPFDDDGFNLPTYPYDEDFTDVWDTDDTYDAYYTQPGPNQGLPLPFVPLDTYDANLHGYRITPDPQAQVPENSNGLQLLMKAANAPPGDGAEGRIAPIWYYPYVIDDGCGPGGNCYRDRITGCANADFNPGDIVESEPGAMIGPTTQGVSMLVAQDPAANWVTTTTLPPAGVSYPRGIVEGGLAMASPRLAVVPTFDADFFLSGHLTGRTELEVVRFVGIFFMPMAPDDTVVGHISPIDFNPGSDNLTDDTSSFLRTVILVR